MIRLDKVRLLKWISLMIEIMRYIIVIGKSSFLIYTYSCYIYIYIYWYIFVNILIKWWLNHRDVSLHETCLLLPYLYELQICIWNTPITMAVLLHLQKKRSLLLNMVSEPGCRCKKHWEIKGIIKEYRCIHFYQWMTLKGNKSETSIKFYLVSHRAPW